MTSKKRVILGKGLGALLKSAESLAVSSKPAEESSSPLATKQTVDPVCELAIHRLTPGPYQPRGKIREAEIEDLAASISAQGVLQPILVRQKTKEIYEIIAGERRWRAAKLAGLSVVPVIIKEAPEEDLMAIALIENIQRENLNALEEAQALERLSKEFHLTHSQVAEAVGKSRTTVTNLLRLLSLTDEVKQFLLEKQLEAGHAKVLLSLKGGQQTEAARVIVAKKLSVRESERFINRLLTADANRSSTVRALRVDPDVQRLEKSLSEQLGAFVAIQHGAQGKGRIQIRYNSLEELEGILAHIHPVK